MSLVIIFCFTSFMVNMFRTLIHTSSGACDRCGDSIEMSQAPDDGCINVRNMLTIKEVKQNTITSDIKWVSYSSTITMMHGPIYIRFTFRSWLIRRKNFLSSLYWVGTRTLRRTLKLWCRPLYVLLSRHKNTLYTRDGYYSLYEVFCGFESGFHLSQFQFTCVLVQVISKATNTSFCVFSGLLPRGSDTW